MSASIQSQVMDAVVAALGGNAAGAYRCRFSPFSIEEVKAGCENVIPESEDAEYVLAGQADIRSRFMVRHMLATVDGVDQAVEARFVRGAQLILADPTLGGLCTTTRYIGRKWEREKAEYDEIALVVTYEAQFSTSLRDPSLRGL